ncbi:MAG: hypothetical protein ACK5ML_07725 [Lachnospiraceae bacterium]
MDSVDSEKNSYLRSNIIRWIPFYQTEKILYIGNNTDAALAAIREMSQTVTVAAPDAIMPNDTFDSIVCIGHLHDLLQNGSNTPEDGTNTLVSLSVRLQNVFTRLSSMLRPAGRLLMPEANKLGLIYWAGMREGGDGNFFSGIENRSDRISFGKNEIMKAAEASGFERPFCYYPFPGYRTTMSIYSDRYLPKTGELTDQTGNTISDRLLLFDESRAMDMLIEEELFPRFSNCIFYVFRKQSSAGILFLDGSQIEFVKFSNDRGEKHNILTEIICDELEERRIVKIADNDQSRSQIANIMFSEKALSDIYKDSIFSINRCSMTPLGMELEFINGSTVEEQLDLLLDHGAYHEAENKIVEILGQIRRCPLSPFHRSGEFDKVFGEIAMPEGLTAAAASDIDMIMSNILVEENGKHTVIDYEWTFHFPIPINFICYRALHYYVETTGKRRALLTPELFLRCGITEEEIICYKQMEEAFQAYILSDHIPLRDNVSAQRPSYHISSVLHVIDGMNRRGSLQIYLDKGNGFREEDSITMPSKSLDGRFKLSYSVPKGIRRIRLDPGSEACTVQIERLQWKGAADSVFDFVSNGHLLDKQQYLFDTEDPNIVIDVIPKERPAVLEIDLQLASMNLAAAEQIAPKIDWKYRLKKWLRG